MQNPKSVVALIALAGAILLATPFLNAPAPSSEGPILYRAEVLDPDFTGGAIAPDSGDYVAWGSDGVVMRSSDGERWHQLDTPTTAEILQLGFDNAGTWVAVGEAGTLLVSSDQGDHWQTKTPDTFALSINDVLYIRPEAGLPVPEKGLWLAVAADGHFLSSIDGGNRWQTSRIDTDDDLLTLTWVKDQGRVLVGGENGLVGTSEDGAAWTIQRADTETPITNFHVFEDLVLGTSAWGRLLLSRNGGTNWHLVQAEKSLYFNDAAYDPVHRSIVLTSHNGHIFHSDDAGESWHLIEAPYQGAGHSLGDVLFDPQTRRLLAFGSHGAVLQSDDGGKNWQERPSGLRESFVKVLYHPQRQTYLALGNRGFRAVSENAAASWQVLRHSFDFYWREGVVTPSGAIVIVGELGQILRSDNAGENWSYVNVTYPDPRTPPTYRALASLDKGVLLAAGPTGLILRSSDQGRNWTVVHHTPFSAGEAFTDLMASSDGSTAIAVEAFGGPYFSTDNGRTWNRAPTDDERNFWHGSALGSTALSVGQSGLLAMSGDAGRNWTRVELAAVSGKDLYGSFASRSHQALFAFGEGGVMARTEDWGRTWHKVSVPTTATLRRMLEIPQSGVLIAFGEKGTIIRSLDGGLHWQGADSGVSVELRAGLIEPHTGYPLIVGRSGTLLRSVDEGLSWARLPTHTQAHFRNGLVHPDTGDLFVFGDRIVRLQRHTQ
ncbi:WD40/YVTN/BNR-like repeat-containing protein [Marinimicrobium agarilyticum]|uniref:WD40/YVTN/BNR-like repeat-containing protein n=1 Tax=Marinimicrobium agarilyticum TaxID=306546 RepID=UPI000425E054|nr:YCF48-related protein [Marinimicrobium agarilyticum]